MQEDGRVVITSIKYNHLHTTAKFESQIEEEIYRVYQMEKERNSQERDIKKIVNYCSAGVSNVSPNKKGVSIRCYPICLVH